MKELAEIRTDLSKLNIIDLNSSETYNSIISILSNILEDITFPKIVFGPGTKLFRSRININSNDYKYIEDFCYRKDYDNIKEFGRANTPNQSVFYCSDIRPTSVSETIATSCLNGASHICVSTSYWKTKTQISVTPIFGNKNTIDKNYLIYKYNDDFEKLIIEFYKENANIVFEILDFISNEFSIDTNGNNNKYKISSAFAQLIYQTNCDGILYPSVQRIFEGINFAIKPEIVDEKLEFILAVYDEIEQTEEKRYCNVAHKEASKDEKNELIWSELKTF